ncbi:MAG: putative sugar O-methyltransferase [Solirubrobacteraceae bacterium]|jgi:putative sugar O-methyltransferase
MGITVVVTIRGAGILPRMSVEPATQRQAPESVEALIESMRRGLADAPAIYKPGEYWDELVAANLEMLRTEGIENLKRTVSNNYYNWLVTALNDSQLHRAIRGWLERPTLAPLVNHLETPATGLRVLNKEGSFALSRSSSWRYKFFVGAIWEVARREDRSGLTERLCEPAVGNPIRVRHRGRLISQDLANSIIELTFVGRSGVVREGSRVAELGAGYGRLAYVYAEACPLTYCIFDIPPTLAVAQWYLTEVLGPERVVPYAPDGDFGAVEPRLKPGVVAFFTPDQMEMFPDGWFDCTQTISTLPEMPRPQAMHHLDLLSAKSGRAVFFKQWKELRNNADNSELAEPDYALPQPWHLAARRVDPVQPGFFNQLWLRD